MPSHQNLAMQDVIDLRDKQHWQARRKVEGPKKIEDIHKEARMEQQRARMAPPPDRRDRRDRIPDRPAMPMCASPTQYPFKFAPLSMPPQAQGCSPGADSNSRYAALLVISSTCGQPVTLQATAQTDTRTISHLLLAPVYISLQLNRVSVILASSLWMPNIFMHC